jgi:hypothetical protein
MELAWLFQARPRLQVPFWEQRSASSTSRNRDYPRQQESAVTFLDLSFRLQDFEDVRWVLLMFVGSPRQYGSASRKAPEKPCRAQSYCHTPKAAPFPVSTGDNSLDGARQCLVRHAIPKPVAQSHRGECSLDSPQNVGRPRHTALLISLPFVFIGLCSSHRNLSLLTHLPKIGCPNGASRANP